MSFNENLKTVLMKTAYLLKCCKTCWTTTTQTRVCESRRADGVCVCVSSGLAGRVQTWRTAKTHFGSRTLRVTPNQKIYKPRVNQRNRTEHRANPHPHRQHTFNR